MTHADNIITFPARATFPALPEKQRTAHRIGDRLFYRAGGTGKTASGTVTQIQMDPLSGGQWRVLLMTEYGAVWRNVWEVWA